MRRLTKNIMYVVGYGCTENACKPFDRTPQRNVVSWNAMNTGYAWNGVCEEALKVFGLMSLTGV